MDDKLEKALLEVITKIAKHFGPMAVLKGGMSLRLQGIDRSTIDADFSFQPSKSKNDFSDSLIDLMNEICDAPVRYSMDSKKLKIDAVYNQSNIIIEAHPYEAFEPIAISTAKLAKRHELQPSIISVVPHSMAFANKLGAWLDRRLARDLYDIYIYNEVFRTKPDLDILEKRISKPSYTRQVKTKPKLNTITDFTTFLKNECDQLSAKEIELELQAIIAPQELQGLGDEIQRSIRKLRSLE